MTTIVITVEANSITTNTTMMIATAMEVVVREINITMMTTFIMIVVVNIVVEVVVEGVEATTTITVAMLVTAGVVITMITDSMAMEIGTHIELMGSTLSPMLKVEQLMQRRLISHQMNFCRLSFYLL